MKVLGRATRDAKLIVCVSHATVNDLLERDTNLEDKIRIVPNGVGDKWSAVSMHGRRRVREIVGDRPFLLSVSQEKLTRISVCC